VEFDFQPDVCCIRADPTQLQQVAMNLILNGVEAVREPGGKVVIRLTTRDVDSAEVELRCDVGQLAPGHYAVLEVQDTGPGIDPSVRPKIFDPFFTTKFAGRGLGLASTAGIVRLLHGAICVRSEVGQGTTFQVLLPMEPASEARAARQVKNRF
jgi:signal transduction histidine kinase